MKYKLDYLSISKRDADCYDVYYRAGLSRMDLVAEGRVAAIRAEFTEDVERQRIIIPGTWRIRREHKYPADGVGVSFTPFAADTPEAIEALRFNTVHEAFAFYCSQVLA